MDIREMIRQAISENDMSGYLDFLMNEQSIYEISEFMNYLYSSYKKESKEVITTDENGNEITTIETIEINNDELFLYFLALLYNEDISYHDFSKIQTLIDNKTITKESLELNFKKIIEIDSDQNYYLLKSNLFRDKILNIYYGRTDLTSYKDEENIKNNAGLLFESLDSDKVEIYKSLPGVIYNESATSEDNGYNLLRYFTRVNDNEAVIEQFYPSFSYLINDINYTDFEKLFINADFLSLSAENRNSIVSAINYFYQKIMLGTIYYE